MGHCHFPQAPCSLLPFLPKAPLPFFPKAFLPFFPKALLPFFPKTLGHPALLTLMLWLLFFYWGPALVESKTPLGNQKSRVKPHWPSCSGTCHQSLAVHLGYRPVTQDAAIVGFQNPTAWMHKLFCSLAPLPLFSSGSIPLWFFQPSCCTMSNHWICCNSAGALFLASPAMLFEVAGMLSYRLEKFPAHLGETFCSTAGQLGWQHLWSKCAHTLQSLWLFHCCSSALFAPNLGPRWALQSVLPPPWTCLSCKGSTSLFLQKIFLLFQEISLVSRDFSCFKRFLFFQEISVFQVSSNPELEPHHAKVWPLVLTIQHMQNMEKWEIQQYWNQRKNQ